MDRNRDAGDCTATKTVALRKESVDRNNLHCVEEVSGDTVALRKESVDRNGLGIGHYCYDVSSLSARRAWIEIAGTMGKSNRAIKSLSARRAWIEIRLVLPILSTCQTSLSARRAWIEIGIVNIATFCTMGRSPQGERG